MSKKDEKIVAILTLNDRLIDFIDVAKNKKYDTTETRKAFIEDENIKLAIVKALNEFKKYSRSETFKFLTAFNKEYNNLCSALKKSIKDDKSVETFSNFVNTNLTSKVNILKKKGASMSLLNGKLTEFCELLSGKK